MDSTAEPASPAEKLTGAQALERLLAMRKLSGDSSLIRVFRCRRDRKIIHLSYRVGDSVWVYHRTGRRGGCRLTLHPLQAYNEPKQDRFIFETYPRLTVDWAKELASVTRRAFVPALQVQLYSQSPLLSQLLADADETC